MRYALVGVHHPLRLDHVPPSPPLAWLDSPGGGLTPELRGECAPQGLLMRARLVHSER
jgi:hypothetical protein